MFPVDISRENFSFRNKIIAREKTTNKKSIRINKFQNVITCGICQNDRNNEIKYENIKGGKIQ